MLQRVFSDSATDVGKVESRLELGVGAGVGGVGVGGVGAGGASRGRRASVAVGLSVAPPEERGPMVRRKSRITRRSSVAMGMAGVSALLSCGISIFVA